jgi:hypothetical protein
MKCKYPGCVTILCSYNLGDACFAHTDPRDRPPSHKLCGHCGAMFSDEGKYCTTCRVLWKVGRALQRAKGKRRCLT